MVRRRLALWLTWVVLITALFAPHTAARAADVELDACPAKMLDLSPYALMAEDASRTLDAQGALALFPGLSPAQAPHELQRGYSSSAWWLKVSLHNATGEACSAWLQAGPPRLRDVRLYVEMAGRWQEWQAGTDYPLSVWALPERKPMFPLVLPPGARATLLMRVYTPGLLVSLSPRLWTPGEFLRDGLREAVLDGAMLGAVLLLAVFGVVLGAIYGRRVLMYMALGMFCHTLWVGVIDNYALVYLWPNRPDINAWVMYQLAALLLFLTNGYCYAAIEVDRLGRWWAWLLKGVGAGYLLLGFFSYWLSRMMFIALIMPLCLFGDVMLTVAAIYAIRRRVVKPWFPLLLVGFAWTDLVVHFSSYLFHTPLSSQVLSTTVLPDLLLLAVVLVVEIRRGRREEMDVRVQLDHQQATERDRLERVVASRTAQLDRSLQARRGLLARIGHDLRGPLASVLDSTRRWQAGDARRDYASLIERNVREQMELIDELLEFSREELDAMELTLAAGYLAAFLRDVAEQAELATERHGNRLACEFAAELPAAVRADFRRLRQVLANLLGNAAKFTDRGTVRFAVDAQPASTAGRVRLRFVIEDDGIGIPLDEKERLLRPYQRGGNASQHEGKGLGLAIVSQLLERMDSQLDIQSQLGRGSRFAFTLDLERAGEEDIEALFGEDASVDVDGQDRVLLVVDDQQQQRELICDLLDGYGFHTVAVADGTQALALLREHAVDMVLTDQCMDSMDGWALLQSVRDEFPELPVMLYSSLPPQRPLAVEPSLTFDASLLKPASAGQLVTMVDTFSTRRSQVAL